MILHAILTVLLWFLITHFHKDKKCISLYCYKHAEGDFTKGNIIDYDVSSDLTTARETR